MILNPGIAIAAGLVLASGLCFGGSAAEKLAARKWSEARLEVLKTLNPTVLKSSKEADCAVIRETVAKLWSVCTNWPGMTAEQGLDALSEHAYAVARKLDDNGWAVITLRQEVLDLYAVAAARHRIPGVRFRAAFCRAKLIAATCPEADLPKAEADVLACLKDPKQDAKTRIEVLSQIYGEYLKFKVDAVALMRQAKDDSDDPKVQAAYYEGMLRYMDTTYGPWGWNGIEAGCEPLDRSCSVEAQLELIERGLADPKLADRGFLVRAKAERLMRLGRYDEAEREYVAACSATNPWQKLDACFDLAQYYEKRAVRFYSPSDAKQLALAVDAYLKARAIGVEPKERRRRDCWNPAAECCVRAGDFAAARKILDGIVALGKGQTNDFVRVQLGRIAWAEKNPAGAAEAYSGISDDPWGRRLYTVEDMDRHARALKLLGREEEELAVLKTLSEKAQNNRKDYYTFAYNRLKAKLDREAGR